MAKKLEEVLNRQLYNPNRKYYPGIPGEQKFYDAHETKSAVFKNIYSSAEYDPLFRGTKIKTDDRQPNHGYPAGGKDAEEYEKVNTTRAVDSGKGGIVPEETIYEAKRNAKDHPEVHKDYEAYKKMSTSELLKHHKSQSRVSHNYSAADVGGKQGLISSLLHAKHGRKRVAGYFRLKEDVEQIDELDRQAGGILSRYLQKNRDPSEHGAKDTPKRKAGRELALKKRWGDKNYGFEEPKVKAVERTTKEETESKKNLTEAHRLDASNLVYHDGHAKSKAFAAEYHKGHKGNFALSNHERHMKNSDSFHSKYHEKHLQPGYGGSGVVQYTHRKTGDVFHVIKSANGRGFHGTDHVIHYQGKHEE